MASSSPNWQNLSNDNYRWSLHRILTTSIRKQVLDEPQDEDKDEEEGEEADVSLTIKFRDR